MRRRTQYRYTTTQLVYRRRVANRECVRCVEPLAEGWAFVQCKECLDVMRLKRQALAMDRPIGRPRKPDAELSAKRLATRIQRDERRENGECIDCGAPTEFFRCYRHRQHAAAMQRRRRRGKQ